MNKVKSLGCLILALALCGCHHSTNQASAVKPIRLSPFSPAIQDVKGRPLTANTHFAAGQLAEAQGSLLVAVKQYNIAVKLNANLQAAWYRLGVVYTELKQYDDAIATFKQYTKVTKDAPSSYSDLGFCLEVAGRPTEAIEAYQQGIQRDPKNLPCRTNYGLMLARHDHTAEAIRMWQPVLTDAEIHYNLASVLESKGRKLDARAEYEQALALDNNMTDAKERLSALDQQ